MPYEIDFIGINQDAKDADAICLRFYDSAQKRYIVGVYDGGTQAYGEALKNHMIEYYFPSVDEPEIDFVICSHSDLDHASGLSVILENFKVKNLIMNRPWLYVDDIFDKVNDGRITKQSLEKRLREAYPYIDNLEKIANDKEIEINEAFEGTTIYKKLKILSPSKQFYLDLLVESNKTPLEEAQNQGLFKKIMSAIKNALETWTDELLREDVSTSAENEMCVVVHGKMDEGEFLLTGDAGIRALRAAIDYSKKVKINLTNVKLQQIPHHGGRHNISPTVLNELIGKIINKGDLPTKSSYVSVSKGSDHPKKMVVNAYIRRGAKVFEARESILWHHNGTPEREGWTNANQLQFSDEVEDWGT